MRQQIPADYSKAKANTLVSFLPDKQNTGSVVSEYNYTVMTQSISTRLDKKVQYST